jgi:acyl-CoA reductase-like NAD-dependent aldehyde dehydrogenase
MIARIVGQLRQGAPLGERKVDVGAMTMPGQVDIVERLVDDAVARGARAVVGGKRGGPGGNFFEPTSSSTSTTPWPSCARRPSARSWRSCGSRDEAEAIALANDSAYGLSSSVFTRDRARGERIARQIVAGSTVINDFAMHYMAQDLPFGGVRGSGFGRLNGPEGLRAMCNTKAVVSDRLPLHTALKMYPVAPAAYDTARGVFKISTAAPSPAAPAASSTSAAPSSAAASRALKPSAS